MLESVVLEVCEGGGKRGGRGGRVRTRTKMFQHDHYALVPFSYF